MLAALSIASAAVAAGNLVVVDAGTGDRRLVRSGTDTFWEAPCLTARGTVIAAGTTRRGRRYVEHRPDGSRRVLGRTGPANTIVPAPGCARVAEGRLDLPGRQDSGLVVRTPGSLRPLVQLPAYWPVEGPWMAWSNDGTRIADIDESVRGPGVRITDVTTGRTVARVPIPRDVGIVQEGAFSPDGTQVLLLQHDWHRTRGIAGWELTVFDAASRGFRTLLRAPVDPQADVVGHAAWSPDGTRLAFQRVRRLPRRRYATDLAVAPAEPGARGRTVLRDLDDDPVVAWAPDSRFVASITR